MTGSLRATIKRLKLAWFGYIIQEDSLSKTILRGTLEGGDTTFGRRNAGWTMQKSRHPCPTGTVHNGFLKTGKLFLLNRPSNPIS